MRLLFLATILLGTFSTGGASLAANPAANAQILFIGSSSIQKWSNLVQEFPDFQTVNLGAGGTGFNYLVGLADSYAEKYPVSRIVVYSGDNDIAWGHKPEQVAENFQALAKKLHAKLPKAKIFLLSIKLCRDPARRAEAADVASANELLAKFAKSTDYIRFVDIHGAMLDTAGEPRAELFEADGIHLSPAGYTLWANALRAALKSRER